MSGPWKRLLCATLAVALALSACRLYAQTSLAGSSLALQSAGSTTLSSAGYLGTYLTVPAGGATVDFTVNATEGAGSGSAPHMNVVIADSTFGLNVASTSASNYTTGNVALPAGTYFVRLERDYDNSNATNRSFTLNNVAVNTVTGSGVTFNNSNTDANALAASDTYIANYRQGDAAVQLPGVAPGTQVQVDLSRIAFNFGTAVPSGTSAYLGSTNTTQQKMYQQALNHDFNAVVPENSGKWGSNEAGNTQPASPNMTEVDTILSYAQQHGMTARMHNLIWGNQQPNWVNSLITAGNTTSLSAAITNRINYYVGGSNPGNADRSVRYSELDVYNESYHTGQNAAAPNYWSLYQPSGIASIYNQVAAAVTAAGANTKLFVNEYNVLQNNGTNYASFYVNNIDQIRNAGGDVGGIGIQYYPSGSSGIGAGDGQHSPARIESTLQNLSVQGLPLSLNEFGVGTGGSTATASTILTDTMRLMFGDPQSTGFFMWGFVSQNGGGNLFQPAAALYSVTTSNWNTFAITDVGKAYEDLLGVQDWDGNPNDGWTTHATTTVNPDGTINFHGYYGEYALTYNGNTYATLDFEKDAAPVIWYKGDFNLDGKVTNADIQAMISALTNVNQYQAVNDLSNQELSAIGDVNGDGKINAADVSALMHLLAGVPNSASTLIGVPEPASYLLLLIGGTLLMGWRWRRLVAG